jgi:tRNA_anti-like
MAVKTKKLVLYGIILAALAGGVYGYYFWNKPQTDVESAEAVKTSAADLYKTFMTDSATSNKTWQQKIVEVSGIADKISVNQKNEKVLLIKTETDGAFVNCTMEGNAEGVKENSSVIIKGICMGIGQGDADLGIPGDVYLTRCYLAK